MYYDVIESPVGDLLLVSNGQALTQVAFIDDAPEIEENWNHAPEILREAVDQLQSYFSGQQQRFDLPLAPQGTEFQQQVWQALQEIPFGATQSYSELANRVGRPQASRAVGAANGRNPIAIIIPCHRVIGANGTLTGYAGGLQRKEYLLQHENPQQQSLLI
ncbi:MAG: methylated-DNA--[protein]-cysteine S-methyltransferase [Wenzhouxiangellaceae bacterium]